MYFVTFMVYITYGISLWVVYLLIFIQLIRPVNQTYFSSSFFTLAKIIAVVDLYGYITFTFMFKVPMNPLLGPLFATITPNYGWSLLYFAGYIVEFIRALLVLATACNRLTSLTWPQTHEMRWKSIMSWVVVISFVVPFCLSFQRLLAPAGVVLVDPMDKLHAFVPGRLDWYPDELNVLHMAIFYIVVGIFTVIVNISSLISLYSYKHDKKQRLPDRSSIRKSEIGLVLVSFSDAIGMLLMIAVQLTLFWLGRQNRYGDPLYNFTFQQLFWIVDFNRFSRPLMLLLICKQVRVVFFRFFGTRCQSSVNINVSSNSNRTQPRRLAPQIVTVKTG